MWVVVGTSGEVFGMGKLDWCRTVRTEGHRAALSGSFGLGGNMKLEQLQS